MMLEIEFPAPPRCLPTTPPVLLQLEIEGPVQRTQHISVPADRVRALLSLLRSCCRRLLVGSNTLATYRCDDVGRGRLGAAAGVGFPRCGPRPLCPHGVSTSLLSWCLVLWAAAAIRADTHCEPSGRDIFGPPRRGSLRTRFLENLPAPHGHNQGFSGGAAPHDP